MNIETKFTIDLDDYLAYQLYSASTNDRIKTKRKREWILSAITFMILGLLFYSNDNSFLSKYFLIAAVLTVLFFPLYSTRRYKNHYLRHIKENYKNNFGKEAKLTIKDDFIQTSDESGQSQISISQLTAINETGQHYFLKLLSGQALIIPKNKLNNPSDFKKALKAISQDLNITHNVDINWKWK